MVSKPALIQILAFSQMVEGDTVKAIAAGTGIVMIVNLFVGAHESPYEK
ncbi:hypothetical protein [Candidatus Borreliella tachyglossi]